MQRKQDIAFDPICDMTMNEVSALRAERDGQMFYFVGDTTAAAEVSVNARAKHRGAPSLRVDGSIIEKMTGDPL